MSSHPPKIIYRYQRFSSLSLGALCNDELYFSDPSAFNDPLECSPSLEQDSDKETLRLILAALIQKRVEEEILTSLKMARVKGDRGTAHAKKQAKQAVDLELKNISYHATNPEYEISVDEAECQILTTTIQNELLKQSNRGICCFSARYDNPLLWSHYGDQHYGFCVGYSMKRKPKPVLNKVVYGGGRKVKTSLVAKAVINKDENAQRDLDENILLRKAAPWKYEKEWRIFDRVGLQDSPLRLEEVIFGLRCSDSVMHSIITALHPRDIQFYRIHIVSGTFKLKRSNDYFGEWDGYLPRTAQSGHEIFGGHDEE